MALCCVWHSNYFLVADPNEKFDMAFCQHVCRWLSNERIERRVKPKKNTTYFYILQVHLSFDKLSMPSLMFQSLNVDFSQINNARKSFEDNNNNNKEHRNNRKTSHKLHKFCFFFFFIFHVTFGEVEISVDAFKFELLSGYVWGEKIRKFGCEIFWSDLVKHTRVYNTLQWGRCLEYFS